MLGVQSIHPGGLLFATQFAQIALVVTEKAVFEDMRVKYFVQKDCAFAGHSFGLSLMFFIYFCPTFSHTR